MADAPLSLDAIYRLAAVLDRVGVPFVFIGGVALNAWARALARRLVADREDARWSASSPASCSIPRASLVAQHLDARSPNPVPPDGRGRADGERSRAGTMTSEPSAPRAA
jgi:hypothetical protein